MTYPKQVAALCVDRRSVYSTIPGVECYDKARDVRTFTGGMPAIGHPPCRSWSAFCAHQSKPEPGEKELGPFVVEWLRKVGGVLEHPAHSRLWPACNLPKPGWTHRGDVWSMEVLQSWWGFDVVKTTWLCFFHINPSDIRIELNLAVPEGSKRKWQLKSKNQRSKTTRAFAEWLVESARKVTNEKPNDL